jgi:hypothetical protein
MIPPAKRHCFTQSPVSAFVERMKREDPEVLFVVATSDDGIQAYLEQNMPGRCIFPARVREPRDGMGSIEGAKEALVDFLSLARCRRILGTYWSSFTDLAAEYGGAELEVIRSSRGSQT